MRTLFFLVTMLCAMMGKSAMVGDAFDLQAELSRPGVKLLVVEFYATWCKPCMEAVPKWKKLHEKYGPKGLRFIVVSIGNNGQCSNPSWSPDRTFCDVEGAIQAEWDVADLPQAFLYSWQGDLLAERAHVEQIEDAIERFFIETQLRFYVDDIDVIGNYAVGDNPIWLKKRIVAEIRKHSKFDVLKNRNIPAYTKSDHCKSTFPTISNLRIQLQGNERGDRTLTLEIEKDGCVLASSQKSYTGEGYEEDRKSLERAADEAVRELLAAVIHIKKPIQPQIYQRAGFGEGLGDLQDLQGESGKLQEMSKIKVPRGELLDDFDTNYMDLIVAAEETDENSQKTVFEKIAAWQKVAKYREKTFARERAERRIREWRTWQKSRIIRATMLKKVYSQYKQDNDKLEKILSYPDQNVSKQQKQAYKNEFNRVYRDVKKDLEQIANGNHELITIIQNIGTAYNGQHDTTWIYSHPTMLYFMKTETTLDQFKACVKAGVCMRNRQNEKTYSGHNSNHPVKCDWYSANDFCEWIGGRLPIEEEWYAEASNNGNREYPWGDQEATCEYAIMNNGTKGCGEFSTWPVCSKPEGNSVSGLCDMSGNVSEWTSTQEGSERVVCGGNYYSDPYGIQADDRFTVDPDKKYERYGFRCVRSTKP